MIPDEFKQQLLNRIDIVDVIERHVPLRKAGQNFVARCPFHSEKTPSFSVSPSKQFYHCFGCGAHGNAITFVMEFGAAGYVDAVKELAALAGMTVPEVRSVDEARPAQPSADLGEVLSAAARYYKGRLKLSEGAVAYLKQRGLTGEIAARFGLGFAPDQWQGLAEVFPDYQHSTALREAGLVIDAEGGRRYDRFRGRIMFPILSARGAIIGFGGRVLDAGEPKYLNSPETSLFQKGQELYGLFQARPALRDRAQVVVVEGYMDVVALAQHGFAAAVATLGTATTPVHVEKLLRVADEIVFCFDGDSAGRRAAWRALEVSLTKLSDARSVKFLFLPNGEDPDSFVRSHGVEAFESKLSDAQPLSEFLVRNLAERVDLTTSEGRARLLHLAKPLVNQIPAQGLGLMLRKKLADCAGVTASEVDELFGVRKSPTNQGKPSMVSSVRRAPQSLTQWILQAVLHNPALAAQVDRALLDSADRHFGALSAVLDLLTVHPNIEAKAIVPMALDVIQENATADVLRELEVALMGSPEVDLNSEFQHAIRGLQERHEARRLAELSAKAQRSQGEQAELERLLSGLAHKARQSAETIGIRV